MAGCPVPRRPAGHALAEGARRLLGTSRKTVSRYLQPGGSPPGTFHGGSAGLSSTIVRPRPSDRRRVNASQPQPTTQFGQHGQRRLPPASIARLRCVKSVPAEAASRGRATTSASRNSSRLMLRPMIAKVCNSMRAWRRRRLPSGALEMSTASTSSAPSASRSAPVRATPAPVDILAGTDLHRLEHGRHGTDARTAAPVSPRWNSTPSPLSRSVATMPSGIDICSIARPPVSSRT